MDCMGRSLTSFPRDMQPPTASILKPRKTETSPLWVWEEWPPNDLEGWECSSTFALFYWDLTANASFGQSWFWMVPSVFGKNCTERPNSHLIYINHNSYYVLIVFFLQFLRTPKLRLFASFVFYQKIQVMVWAVCNLHMVTKTVGCSGCVSFLYWEKPGFDEDVLV